MHSPSLLTALTAVLATVPAAQAGLYSKSSPVLQVNARTYDKLIAKSNHTTLVEFYAPWCGHCRNLQPAYEKAATKLGGLAKVAAVDCDEEANKPFCGSMGVEGFPTLKIVRPSMKPGGKPVVEDYKGPRTATSLIQATVDKINNHVTKVADKDLDKFLGESDKPKLLLFTEKGTTSAMLRSVAIDFLDVVSVAQIRNTQKAAVEKYSIDEFPKVVLLPGEGQDPVYYEGEIEKAGIVKFLAQVAEPNPDPAPAKSKSKSKDKKDKEAKPEPAAEPAPEAEASADTETPAATPEPEATIVPIPAVASYQSLAEQCLQPKSHTCVLAFVPKEASTDAENLINSLSQLQAKYIAADRHMFPFLPVLSEYEGVSELKEALELTGAVELVAINARRSWMKRHSGEFGVTAVEEWMDALRMGDGEKTKLPKSIVAEVTETKVEESATEEPTQATDPEPEVETEAPEAEASGKEEL
jgi:protein disulfide-isomerase A6